MFELSPNATVLAANIGQEIFLKVLNQVHRQQWRNTLDYQESIAFMPIYLDEDYNFTLSVKRYVDEKRKEKEAKRNAAIKEEREEIEDMFNEDQSDITPDTSMIVDGKISLKVLQKNIANFQVLQRFQGTMYAKNEKQL